MSILETTASRESWQSVRLGEVCNLVNGNAYKESDWYTDGVPIIRIQNLNDPAKSFNYWPGSLERRVLVDSGDVLLAWSGTPGTSFGAHYWSRGRGVLNQHIFRVDLDAKRIDPHWAVLVINHELGKLITLAHGAVGLAHVTRPECESVMLPLPSLSDQQRIVAKLDEQMAALDGAEQALAEQQAAASAIATAVLQQAFSGSNSDRSPKVALGKILSLEYGRGLTESVRVPGEYPVMGSNGIVGYHNEYLVSGPSIVVGRKGSSGKVTWADENCFPIDTTYFVVPKTESVALRFLFFFLQWSNLGRLSEASGVPGLNRDHVYELLCPTPPLVEQSRIVNHIEAVDTSAVALLDDLTEVKSSFVAMRTALLDAAFSGEI